jgi:hypothetical protein
MTDLADVTGEAGFKRDAVRIQLQVDEDLLDVDASWTSDGRGGGRRGSNPQLQPWEGAGPFLNSGVRDNRL